jgi:hypothetical protein
MTPWQTGKAIGAHSEKLQADYANAISIAWHGAAFERSKKLPELRDIMQKLLPNRKPKKLDEKLLVAYLNAYNRKQGVKNGR